MNQDIFQNFPKIETERLLLRQLVQSDTEKLFEFNSNLETLKYIARSPFTKMEQAELKMADWLKAYADKKAIWWAFTSKETDQFIGYGGYFNICNESNKAEIGYGLLTEFWGQGYMSEIASNLVRFGIASINLHRISAIVIPGNEASVKVLKKNGFEKEGHLRDDSFARNRYFDSCIYGLINNR